MATVGVKGLTHCSRTEEHCAIGLIVRDARMLERFIIAILHYFLLSRR